ncbi:MAG: rod shape-determining protein MreD [Firmicutes bacterium]|nr:rod shape-determining protein MreD [Bacillota bacterium]
MRWLFNLVLFVFSFAINFGLLDKLELNYVKADFFLVIIICLDVLRNETESILFGFFLGLTRDIFFGEKICFYAIIYAVTGYLFCKPFKYFYRENFFIPMILVFFATIFFEITGSVFYYGFSFYKYSFYVLSKIIFPKAIYNVVLILFFYPILYCINKKVETLENRFIKR